MNSIAKTTPSLVPGVYAASLTPMHEDLSCNYQELAKHCQDLIDRGCQGIVLFGTTGEGTSFSVAEREKTVKNVVQLGIDPHRILVGISCCAIDDAATLASVAIEQQCAAVLIAPPFFYKHVDEVGVIDFYRKVIQKVNHPALRIILYHIPQCSGVPLTLHVIKKLREEFPKAVIGLKESEGNLSFTKYILAAIPDFQVFVGREPQISEAIQLGASGAISGIANAYPELICSLYKFGKDHKQANNNEMIQKIVKTLSNYPIFPAIKHLVEKQKGAAWHLLRPPLTPLTLQQSKACLENLKL